MTQLKIGDVGYMKITGEPAFLLKIDPPEREDDPLGPFVVVRLTGTSQKGPANYPVKDVRMAELESLEDRARRDFQETSRLKKLAKELTEDPMVDLPKMEPAKVLPN